MSNTTKTAEFPAGTLVTRDLVQRAFDMFISRAENSALENSSPENSSPENSAPENLERREKEVWLQGSR